MFDALLNTIVFGTSIFNFLVIVFFYKREEGRFCRLMSVAAMLIAAGQLGNIIMFLNKVLVCNWTFALMQIGLAIVFYVSQGSVKLAAVSTVTHRGKDDYKKAA